MNEKQALSAFSALSNETRLRLLKALVRAGTEGLSAGALADHVNATPSRTSFHLSDLEKSGLVLSEKHARNVVYRVDFQRIGQLVSYIIEDCCAGHETVKTCCGMA